MKVRLILKFWWQDTLKSRLLSLVIVKAQHSNKHKIQSWRIWENPLNQIFNTIICIPKTERKVAKKFKIVLSNPFQIWLIRNYKIQIHQKTRMRQDLNQNPRWSQVIFSAYARQGSIFPTARYCSIRGNDWEWSREIKLKVFSQTI